MTSYQSLIGTYALSRPISEIPYSNFDPSRSSTFLPSNNTIQCTHFAYTEFLLIYLSIRFDLPRNPSSINLRDKRSSQSQAQNAYQSHPRESKVVGPPLDFTGMIFYQSLIVSEAVGPSRRHIQHRYIWLPLLRLTPDGRVPLGLSP